MYYLILSYLNKSYWTEHYETWKQCTFALSVKLEILKLMLQKYIEKLRLTDRIIYDIKLHFEVCEREEDTWLFPFKK